MSTEHNPLNAANNKPVSLTSYSGGERGRMLQLTQLREGGVANHASNFQAVHMTREQVAALRDALDDWLIGDLPMEGEEESPGGNLETILARGLASGSVKIGI